MVELVQQQQSVRESVTWYLLHCFDLWQVKFCDDVIRPALAPFVSLLNHSPWPHIVHFSTVNPTSKTLDLKTFRPVQQQQQVFLSYGPVPNHQLLLFYGFAAVGNPNDELALLVPDAPLITQQQQQQQEKVQQHGQGQSQGQCKDGGGGSKDRLLSFLQQLGLGERRFELTLQQPLPDGLLPCLRIMCASTDELVQLQGRFQLQTQGQPQQTRHQQSQGVSSKLSGLQAVQQQAGKAASVSQGSNRKGRQLDNAQMVATASNSSGGSSSGIDQHLPAVWAAAMKCSQVAGHPVSDDNEQAAKHMLKELLQTAAAPYETCLAKIGKRRQLQALLQAKQVMNNNCESSSVAVCDNLERGFVDGLEVYLHGILSIYQACATQAGV
jgi:hypothetical protein